MVACIVLSIVPPAGLGRKRVGGKYETCVKATRVLDSEDFYFENGLMVLTERYLLKRGYCCGNGCRHCPYGHVAVPKDSGGEPGERRSVASDKPAGE
jgi:hypothetical protein